MSRRRCQAIVETPPSERSRQKKGVRCILDATVHIRTKSGERVRLCWLHGKARQNQGRNVTLETVTR